MKKHVHITEDQPLPDSDNSKKNVAAEPGNSSSEQLQDAESAESDVLAKLELDLASSQDKYLRLLSEFDNYKKRVARDRMDMIKMAGSDILLSVLPVLDDLERALQAGASTGQATEGVVLIYNKLKSILESKGLKVMDTVGLPFDADLHDAISSMPGDEKSKGMVIQEIEKGYYLNDKVVRHAKVIVGA